MTVAAINLRQPLVYDELACSLSEAAKKLLQATVQQDRKQQEQAYKIAVQISLEQNDEYFSFIKKMICILAPDQVDQRFSARYFNEGFDRFWDGLEGFFCNYQQEDAFDKFKELLQHFSNMGICALNPPICHLFAHFFLQPPALFLRQYAQSTEIQPFLQEVFKRLFIDQDTQFWLDGIFHENAWPQAALSFRLFLLARPDPLPLTAFPEVFNRLVCQTADPDVLCVLAAKAFDKSDLHEYREVVRDVLAKKMNDFQGVFTQSVRALQLAILFLRLPVSWHNLKDQEIIAQAWTMATCSFSQVALYKKSERIRRSVLVDPEPYDHDFSYFVLSKRKVELLQASGCFKRVTSAVRCSVSSQGTLSGQLVAQSVNLYKNPSTNEFFTDDTIEINALFALRERKYALMLLGLPGVVQLKSSFCYNKQVTPEHRVPKVSLMWEFYDMDLSRAIDQNKIEGLFDKRQIAEDLLVGLESIHGKGLFHWDIKAGNVLCRREGDVLRACWCDYGMMFHLDEALDRIQLDHNGSFYGSVAYTPPENFTLEEYATHDGLEEKLKRVEVWALGQLLYKLYHSQGGIAVDTPWLVIMAEIAHLHGFSKRASREKWHALKPLFHAVIIDAYAELDETEDPFLLLIYSMLNPDPTQRPSVARCLEVIKEISKS